MRTIVHISDLHFGRSDPQLVDPLIQTIRNLNPNLIAVSGDLTQRARSHEFEEARGFLDSFPQPKIVVPGNHDVPLYNIYDRFFRPLDKFRRYITEDPHPAFADNQMIVIGVSTARSLVVKGGRINQQQLTHVKEKFCALPDEAVKILVTHHPFDLPSGHDDSDLVGRAEMAMAGLAQCGADLFLAGHLHVSHTGNTAKRYRIEGHSALVVQAGTAISSRGRGEANSFNLIRIEHPEIVVERFGWISASDGFSQVNEERFLHSAEGWTRVN